MAFLKPNIIPQGKCYIGGFNCSPGIVLAVVAKPVQDIRGNQNFMRIAGAQIFNRADKRLWITSCGTHIEVHLSISLLPFESLSSPFGSVVLRPPDELLSGTTVRLDSAKYGEQQPVSICR